MQLYRFTLTCLCTFLAAFPLAAQPGADTLRYAGPYRLGEFSGRADFGYGIQRRDTVRTGPFSFRVARPADLLEGGDAYRAFRGSYAEGVPAGPWTFDYADYRPGDSVAVTDHVLHLALDGTHVAAAGSLEAGLPEGNWTHRVARIRNGRPAEELLRSEMTFGAGVPRQSFRIESGPAVLLGRVDRAGVATDEWVFDYDLRTVERWQFVEGSLRQIVRGSDTLRIAPLATRRSELVPLDERYFAILAILTDASPRLATDPVSSLLLDHAAAFRRTREALAALGTPAPPANVRVRVPSAPLTRREIAALDRIEARLGEVDTLAAALLSTSALSVVENADPEVATLRREVLRIRDSLLAPARSLREAYRADVLPYVPRADYLRRLYPDSGADLAYVEGQTDAARAAVDSLRAALGTKSNTRERQQVATALQSQLEREAFLLDSLIASRPDAGALGLDGVAKVANAELGRYRGNPELLDRNERAQQLVACVEDLDALALELIRLPERQLEVKAAYTNEVWNNFTATVMEEIVQKRVYRAYEEDLIPYYRKRVANDLSCPNAAILTTELQALHRRVLALRGQDTDELESRLRREDDPLRMLELLTAAQPQ